MSKMPDFLNTIQNYKCINLSTNGKQLKPTTDLVTPEQQQSLTYVLDIFPGLYCQRIALAGFQPKTIVIQPVLVVSFDWGVFRQHGDPVKSEAMMDCE